MLKLLSENKPISSYSSIEGFNIFHILEGLFLNVDTNSLLPSDRVLVDLYRYKYGRYSRKDEEDLIKLITEKGSFNTWREAVEAYVYSYILLKRNNFNRFESLKECTGEFLNQLKNIDTDLWDDDLGFSLGLTFKLQHGFVDIIYNSIIEKANPIFKLNFYFGMKVRENLEKLKQNEINTYDEAIRISTEVAGSIEYSAVRRAPALCFLRDESIRDWLSREVLGELINNKFYSRAFGWSLSEDTLSSSDYNFKPASLFRILLVFRILGWDKLIMVSPDLLYQAKLLKEKNGSAIAVTKQQYIRENIVWATFSAIIGGLSVWLYLKIGFYGLSSIIIFLLPYLLKMRRTTKGDLVKND